MVHQDIYDNGAVFVAFREALRDCVTSWLECEGCAVSWEVSKNNDETINKNIEQCLSSGW